MAVTTESIRLRALSSANQEPKTLPRASTSINEPKQDRSRASFDRVLDSAEDLLKECGYKRFTLREVSRRSRTSIGSIYCRVKCKDDLFHAVQDHVLARLNTEMESVLNPSKWDKMEARKVILYLVRELAEYLRRHAPILRALISRENDDPVVMTKGRNAYIHMSGKFRAILLRYAGEFSHASPEHAVSFCFNLVDAAIAKHLDLNTITPSNDGSQWNQLIDDLGRAMCLFLLSTEAPEADSAHHISERHSEDGTRDIKRGPQRVGNVLHA